MSEVPKVVDPWVLRFEELAALLKQADLSEEKASDPIWLKNNIYTYRGRLGEEGLRKALQLIKQVHE